VVHRQVLLAHDRPAVRSCSVCCLHDRRVVVTLQSVGERSRGDVAVRNPIRVLQASVCSHFSPATRPSPNPWRRSRPNQGGRRAPHAETLQRRRSMRRRPRVLRPFSSSRWRLRSPSRYPRHLWLCHRPLRRRTSYRCLCRGSHRGRDHLHAVHEHGQ